MRTEKRVVYDHLSFKCACYCRSSVLGHILKTSAIWIKKRICFSHIILFCVKVRRFTAGNTIVLLLLNVRTKLLCDLKSHWHNWEIMLVFFLPDFLIKSVFQHKANCRTDVRNVHLSAFGCSKPQALQHVNSMQGVYWMHVPYDL